MCMYDGKCRQYCIVYKVTCKFCNTIYIRNTQQSFKQQMNGYFNNVCKLVSNGTILDSFAKHFAQHFNSAPMCKTLCDNMQLEILSQLNPIGAMKTFGSRNCSLCMNKHLTIVKWMPKNPKLVINSCSKIYRACWHNSKFHRFIWH